MTRGARRGRIRGRRYRRRRRLHRHLARDHRRRRVDIAAALANGGAVAAWLTALGADVVARPPDLDLVLIWNRAGDLVVFVGFAVIVHYVRKERELLRLEATHDPLTRLPNRVLFLDRLEQA